MYDGWPKISRSSADIGQLNPDPYLSTDLEWNVATGVPTILGLSDGRTSISVPWNDGKAAFQERLDRTQPILLGHNFLSSDYQVLEKAGFKIRPEQVLDTIHLHWLTNMSLCKAKKAEDEEGERRGRGYMNLWTWCSLYTDAANWKDCIGESCVELGNPCPIHNPYDYNGCDAYWPVQAVGPTLSRARLMGVDRLLPLHRDLALVLAGMQERGLYVNRQYVSELRGWFKGEQARLRAGMTYNPDSPKQVVQYFKDKGIPLENAQQATIDALCDGDEYGADDELLILQEYGRLGNGPDRWFKDRTWDSTKGEWNGYVDAQGFIHCSLQFFTSSARLVCSNPNLQNVAHRPRKFETNPKNTLAMRIRRAIEAPEGMWLYEADYSNAENRVMLHLAGHPVGQDVDLHTWVAELAGFQASDPFCMQEGSPRQAAKTVQHGCLTGDHEVLTPKGWVRIDAWEGQEIAQWDTKGAIRFGLPEVYHVYDEERDIVKLTGRGIKTLVTQDHSFPVVVKGKWKDRSYAKWRKCMVGTWPKTGSIPIAGNLSLAEKKMADEDILQCVAIQADGCTTRGNKASFHLVKKRKQERLEVLFGVAGNACGCHEGGMRYSVEVPKGSILDTQPKQFNSKVLEMTEDQRQLFLDEVLLWDGCIQGDRDTYSNTSYGSCVWVQTVAHLTGQQCLMREAPLGGWGVKTSWVLSFNRRQLAGVGELVTTREPYKGKVYCFTVPTHYFLVRYANTISVTGNSNYGEGLQLLSPSLARSSKIRDEVARGLRLLYPDWLVFGQVVSFTGINFARRAFGSASWENRRRANDILARYFGRFTGLRLLQQRVSTQVERESCVRNEFGYVLPSYGYEHDRIKIAWAFTGQNPVAQATKLAMLRFAGHPYIDCRLQVHDSLLFYVDRRWEPTVVCIEIRRIMEEPLCEMGGLVIPVEVKFGPNWADTKKIKIH